MKLRKVKAFSFFEDLPGENSDEDFVEFQVFEHQEDEMPGHAPGDLDLALKSLKEQQRQCVELVYLEGKSYEEVCVITGYRYKEVKSHVQNGKRNLKLKLEEINAKRT
jgi:RNA polymerase sigma-70 factor (ECF subfamily)